ncbi:MAG: shikimate kinase [Chromatiales bacterium]|nr:shikimate kinase [Chromatiales bacterium]
MGAGKSTVGRRLAEDLSWPFYDADREIEQRTGVDIPTIFEYEGEVGFREREARAIDELTLHAPCVLATGGGAVLREDNRRLLAERGCVVYLYCPVAEQLRRTAHDRNRPLLQTDDPAARLQALFETRDPLYRAIADVVIESGRRSVAAVAREIRGRLSECS